MSESKATAGTTADREMVFTRLLDAPRELVFEVWTKPEHLLKWWGPDGFTQTFYEFDMREGGIWRFMMHGPDGRDYPNKVLFKEVVKPFRLVFKHSGDDDSDGVSHESVITFEEENGKTKLTMKMIFASAEEMQRVMKEYGAEEGGKQHLAKLEAYIYSVVSEKSNQIKMEQQNYHSRITANITAQDAFDRICRISDWWTQNLDGASQKLNDIFTVHFGETFVTSQVAEVVPNEKIVWLVTDCNKHWLKNKKEWIGTKMVWEISNKNGSTEVNFTHIGLQPELECYTDCEKGWNFYIKESLSKLLTEGKGRPDTPQSAR